MGKPKNKEHVRRKAQELMVKHGINYREACSVLGRNSQLRKQEKKEQARANAQAQAGRVKWQNDPANDPVRRFLD